MSGKAPWSDLLVGRQLHQRIDQAILSVLLTLGLPALIQGSVRVSPSGSDGCIEWAEFWAQQRALAVHAQCGVTEEHAAIAFAEYICGLVRPMICKACDSCHGNYLKLILTGGQCGKGL